MTDDAEIARLQEWARSHERSCDQDRQEIKATTSEIKTAITNLANDMKGAVQRIHERIDGDHVDTAKKFSGVHARISNQKSALLVAAVIGLLGLLGYALSNWGPLSEKAGERAAERGRP